MSRNKDPKINLTYEEYLQLFKRKLDELKEASFIREEITLSFPSESTNNITISDRVLDSVLLRSRPFLLQNEIFYFHAVCNYLENNCLLSPEDTIHLRE